MDSNKIHELERVLEQETNVYEDILKLSENKTDMIVGGKVSELESIVKIEQSFIFQLGRLEMAREKLVESIAAELGMAPSDLTVSEIIKRLDAGQGGQLKGSQDKMTCILAELKNKNELNTRLIRNSLDFIDFSMNVLTSVSAPDTVYANNGQTGDPKKRTFFDVKL